MKWFLEKHPFVVYVPPVLAGLLVLVLKLQALEVFTILVDEVLLAWAYAAAVMDYRSRRVPNKLILGMLASYCILLIPLLLLYPQQAFGMLLSAGAGGLITGVIALLVYLASRKGLGGGDVKFMAVSGLYLGFSGSMQATLIGALLAAGFCGVSIARKKMTSKDAIPLVPFLYIGILASILLK